MDYKSLPTPCFIVHEAKMRESVVNIRESLARYWSNSILSFSVKTNSMPEVNRILASENVWAEVVSDFEFDHALSCGYKRGNFVCNGVSKSPSYIRKAIDSNSILHLDSISEVQQFFEIVGDSECTFGVRINATESDFNAEPLSGPLASRFGLSARDGDMVRIQDLLRQHPNAKLTSLHLHCNTKTRGINGYLWLTHFFSRLVKEYSLSDVSTFDIGGSFGHDFDHPADGEGRWPSWNEYFAAISSALKSEGFTPDNLHLVIEPGSSLISGCVDYLTRIVGERTFNGQRVLQMDGSRIHLDPHFARASFAGAMKVISDSESRRASTSSQPTAYIGGSTCLEKDRIPADDAISTSSPSDLILFQKAGAYTYGLSPALFINPLPKVVLN